MPAGWPSSPWLRMAHLRDTIPTGRTESSRFKSQGMVRGKVGERMSRHREQRLTQKPWRKPAQRFPGNSDRSERWCGMKPTPKLTPEGPGPVTPAVLRSKPPAGPELVLAPIFPNAPPPPATTPSAWPVSPERSSLFPPKKTFRLKPRPNCPVSYSSPAVP